MPNYSCEIFERPGLEWSSEKKHAFIPELRSLAKQCLDPVPEYQCLSLSAAGALDDKLIAVARRDDTGEVVGFSSAVFLEVPKIGTILHTGLTCVHPSERRSGLTVVLFGHLFGHLMYEFPEGIWLTTIAAIPSSLVSIYQLALNVFPSPKLSEPSPTHLNIAEAISSSHRPTMLISPEAVLDTSSFILKKCNPPGSPFRKNVGDPSLQHRNEGINDFYRNLLKGGDGDVVLQVAFFDSSNAAEIFTARFSEISESKVGFIF